MSLISKIKSLVASKEIKENVFLKKYNSQIESAYSEVKEVIMSGHYDAGAKNRLTNDWSTKIASISANIKPQLRDIIGRSISLYDNNLEAKSLVNTPVTNIVGCGIDIKSAIKNDSGELDEELNKIIDGYWERYKDEWSSENDISYFDSQRIRLREIFVSGGSLTRIVPTRYTSDLLPIRNQILSVLRLDESHDLLTPSLNDSKTSNNTFFGINFDKYGETQSYYLTGIDNAISKEFMKMHFFRDFAEQFIGLPSSYTAAKYLWGMDKILAAKIVSTEILSKIALYVSSTQGANLLANSKALGNNNVSWQSGSIIYGESNQEPKVIQAKDDITPITDSLLKFVQHICAAGNGLSHQGVNRDLNGASMASARINVNSDKKTYKMLQSMFIDNVLKFDRATFIKYLFLSGNLSKYGVYYSDYANDPWKYNRAVYEVPTFEQVDPKNETIADEILIANRLKTRKDYFSERNKNYDEQEKQFEKEAKDQEKYQIEETNTDPNSNSKPEPKEDDSGSDKDE